MVFFLKVGACMVSKSENTQRKFILKVGACMVSKSKTKRKFVRGGVQRREQYQTNLLFNIIHAEIWACMVSILKVRCLHGV